MRHHIRTATIVLASFTAIASLAWSSADQRSGLRARNDDAPAQLEQLDYLVGRWKVTTYVRNQSGEFQPVKATSFMEGRYLFDGYGLVVEHHVNDPDDFYSINIITWDDDLGRFALSFHNPKKNRHVTFDARVQDGVFVISNRGGYAQDGDFLYRESDLSITETSFTKRLHRSDDGGETWNELGYYFTYERLDGDSW